ncbi:MAG: hypothetical protein Q7S86_01755 [bacterium]|nr:hypothetical protein [bacterium]
MKKGQIVAVAAGILIVGGGAFYAGTKYRSSNSTNAAGVRGAFANLSPEERQTRFAQVGVGPTGARASRGTDAGFVSGEVISKDDKSITLKLADGGSKIVFLSGTAAITKSISGSFEDIVVGERVMITGTANSDGSMTGQTVQIRPEQ